MHELVSNSCVARFDNKKRIPRPHISPGLVFVRSRSTSQAAEGVSIRVLVTFGAELLMCYFFEMSRWRLAAAAAAALLSRRFIVLCGRHVCSANVITPRGLQLHVCFIWAADSCAAS